MREWLEKSHHSFVSLTHGIFLAACSQPPLSCFSGRPPALNLCCLLTSHVAKIHGTQSYLLNINYIRHIKHLFDSAITYTQKSAYLQINTFMCKQPAKTLQDCNFSIELRRISVQSYPNRNKFCCPFLSFIFIENVSKHELNCSLVSCKCIFCFIFQQVRSDLQSCLHTRSSEEVRCLRQ